MTWETFLGLSVLVGFLVTVVTPIAKLSKTLGVLNANLLNLKETFSNIVSENTESHKKITESLDSAFKMIRDHEKRLVKVETKIDIKD